MSEAKMDQFMPLDLGWIAKKSQDWDPADAGPLFWVIIYMWPQGGRALNNDRKLAKVASVTPKAWARICKAAGDFFRVEGDFLVQDDLMALYAEKAKTYGSNRNKTSAAAKVRWDAHRAAQALKAVAADAPSNASCIASSNPSRNASGPVRAFLERDLDLILKEEEGSNASAVPKIPVSPDDPEVLAAILAYPKQRQFPGSGPTEVAIGESAARLAAEYLTKHPGYPLLLAAKYTAARDKRPPNFAKWIADPPAAAVVLAAYEAKLKRDAEDKAARAPYEPADPVHLRRLVDDINQTAGRNLAHA